MKSTRLEIVEQLLECSVPLDDLVAELRSFGWDYEGEQAELNRKHLNNVLKRFLGGELSADDVERWANLAEGREDICFEAGIEEALEDILHQLANPVLVGRLTKERANEMLERLSFSSEDSR